MAGEKARIMALDADLTYNEITGRVTALQVDVTHGEVTAQVTAVEARCTETLSGTAMPDLGARLMAVQVAVTRHIHHKSTFAAPISRTLTFRAPISRTLTYKAPLDPRTVAPVVSRPHGGGKEPQEEFGE